MHVRIGCLLASLLVLGGIVNIALAQDGRPSPAMPRSEYPGRPAAAPDDGEEVAPEVDDDAEFDEEEPADAAVDEPVEAESVDPVPRAPREAGAARTRRPSTGDTGAATPRRRDTR